ncbi:hypothetical protein [Brevibacillus reuszeri]|uniref:hypothetical protein n=1 Tax=Brevibacillus reuszeri TaxID=54915 RepID=UPI000CCC54FC|nr:hypothetical protein [Brevibacillus reuszeri]
MKIVWKNDIETALTYYLIPLVFKVVIFIGLIAIPLPESKLGAFFTLILSLSVIILFLYFSWKLINGDRFKTIPGLVRCFALSITFFICSFGIAFTFTLLFMSLADLFEFQKVYWPYIFPLGTIAPLIFIHLVYLKSSFDKKQAYNELRVTTLLLIGLHGIVTGYASSDLLQRIYQFDADASSQIFTLYTYPLIGYLLIYIAVLEYKASRL